MDQAGGKEADMPSLSIIPIVIGIVLALLVNYILGIVVILTGLAMQLVPLLGTGTRRRV
jgi:hypothetical protein